MSQKIFEKTNFEEVRLFQQKAPEEEVLCIVMSLLNLWILARSCLITCWQDVGSQTQTCLSTFLYNYACVALNGEMSEPPIILISTKFRQSRAASLLVIGRNRFRGLDKWSTTYQLKGTSFKRRAWTRVILRTRSIKKSIYRWFTDPSRTLIRHDSPSYQTKR